MITNGYGQRCLCFIFLSIDIGHGCMWYILFVIKQGCGSLFIFTGLTSSLQDLLFISSVIFIVPLPLQFFRVCYIHEVSTWTPVGLIISKLFRFWLLTEGARVAYILKWGARPCAIWGWHTIAPVMWNGDFEYSICVTHVHISVHVISNFQGRIVLTSIVFFISNLRKFVRTQRV